MKNKSKLAKIKNQNSNGNKLNLPEGWLIMAKEKLTVNKLYDILSDEYEVEIWTDLGIAEVILGEKSSMDVELIDTDLGDDYSNTFVKEKEVSTIYYLSFKPDDYSVAKKVMEKISLNIDGFICGDTDTFEPVL